MSKSSEPNSSLSETNSGDSSPERTVSSAERSASPAKSGVSSISSNPTSAAAASDLEDRIAYYASEDARPAYVPIPVPNYDYSSLFGYDRSRATSTKTPVKSKSRRQRYVEQLRASRKAEQTTYAEQQAAEIEAQQIEPEFDLSEWLAGHVAASPKVQVVMLILCVLILAVVIYSTYIATQSSPFMRASHANVNANTTLYQSCSPLGTHMESLQLVTLWTNVIISGAVALYSAYRVVRHIYRSSVSTWFIITRDVFLDLNDVWFFILFLLSLYSTGTSLYMLYAYYQTTSTYVASSYPLYGPITVSYPSTNAATCPGGTIAAGNCTTSMIWWGPRTASSFASPFLQGTALLSTATSNADCKTQTWIPSSTGTGGYCVLTDYANVGLFTPSSMTSLNPVDMFAGAPQDAFVQRGNLHPFAQSWSGASFDPVFANVSPFETGANLAAMTMNMTALQTGDLANAFPANQTAAILDDVCQPTSSDLAYMQWNQKWMVSGWAATGVVFLYLTGLVGKTTVEGLATAWKRKAGGGVAAASSW